MSDSFLALTGSLHLDIYRLKAAHDVSLIYIASKQTWDKGSFRHKAELREITFGNEFLRILQHVCTGFMSKRKRTPNGMRFLVTTWPAGRIGAGRVG